MPAHISHAHCACCSQPARLPLVSAQVSSITIQPEVLHLLRSLLVTWLPRSELIRSVMTSLPHVTPQVRAHAGAAGADDARTAAHSCNTPARAASLADPRAHSQRCMTPAHCHARTRLQVLSSFTEQLLSLNSDKEQRSLIKTLLAEAGGEQARAVLSAVSKVPVMNMPEPKARPQQQGGAGGGAAAAEEIRWDWSEAGIAL